MDLRQLILHAGVEFLQGIALHVRTVVAGASVLRRGRDEGLLRGSQLHLVDDPRLGGDDELLPRVVDGIVQQSGGRADEMGLLQDMRLAFGMGDQLGLRMANHQLGDLFIGKDLVHHAGPVPDHHVATGLLDQVGAEVLVGGKNDGLILGDAVDDVHRVGGGTTDIRQRLHLRGAVDVTDHHMIGVFFLELAEERRWTGISQGTSRLQVGKKHLLLRGQHLGRLRHEVHPGEDDDIRIRTGRLL